jgi:glutathione S-transferase
LVAKLEGVHLFHFDAAPCAQRVRFALAEKGLARGKEVRWDSDAPATLRAEDGTWTSRAVSLIKKQHLTDAYAAIQPNMVVPALVHDGRLYVESMDIIDYLDEVWPANPLRPTDPAAAQQAKALVERGKELHVSVRYVSFRWGLGRLGKLGADDEARLHRLEREGSPEKLVEFYGGFDHDRIDEATYRDHLDALQDGYAAIERLLASDGRSFLTGDTLSTADIIWSMSVLRLDECGYPFQANFPRLHAWYSRIAERPAFREGVMGKHRAMNRAFRMKAAVENFLGVGLRSVSRAPARA